MPRRSQTPSAYLGSAWLQNIERYAMLKTTYDQIGHIVPRLSTLKSSQSQPRKVINEEAVAKRREAAKKKQEMKAKEESRAKRESEAAHNAWVQDNRERLLAIQQKRKEDVQHKINSAPKHLPHGRTFRQGDTDNSSGEFLAWIKEKDDQQKEIRRKAKQEQNRLEMAIKEHDLKARQKNFEYTLKQARPWLSQLAVEQAAKELAAEEEERRRQQKENDKQFNQERREKEKQKLALALKASKSLTKGTTAAIFEAPKVRSKFKDTDSGNVSSVASRCKALRKATSHSASSLLSKRGTSMGGNRIAWVGGTGRQSKRVWQQQLQARVLESPIASTFDARAFCSGAGLSYVKSQAWAEQEQVWSGTVSAGTSASASASATRGLGLSSSSGSRRSQSRSRSRDQRQRQKQTQRRNNGNRNNNNENKSSSRKRGTPAMAEDVYSDEEYEQDQEQDRAEGETPVDDADADADADANADVGPSVPVRRKNKQQLLVEAAVGLRPMSNNNSHSHGSSSSSSSEHSRSRSRRQHQHLRHIERSRSHTRSGYGHLPHSHSFQAQSSARSGDFSPFSSTHSANGSGGGGCIDGGKPGHGHGEGGQGALMSSHYAPMLPVSFESYYAQQQQHLAEQYEQHLPFPFDKEGDEGCGWTHGGGAVRITAPGKEEDDDEDDAYSEDEEEAEGRGQEQEQEQEQEADDYSEDDGEDNEYEDDDGGKSVNEAKDEDEDGDEYEEDHEEEEDEENTGYSDDEDQEEANTSSSSSSSSSPEVIQWEEGRVVYREGRMMDGKQYVFSLSNQKAKSGVQCVGVEVLQPLTQETERHTLTPEQVQNFCGTSAKSMELQKEQYRQIVAKLCLQ